MVGACAPFFANKKPPERLSMLLLHTLMNLAFAVTIHRAALFNMEPDDRVCGCRPFACSHRKAALAIRKKLRWDRSNTRIDNNRFVENARISSRLASVYAISRFSCF
jgi:hypothetical protein